MIDMLKALKQRSRYKRLAPFFDAEYYLRANPDVAAASVNPLRHYLEHGWREGRNPSADFDTRFYLSHYPDVADSDNNPLIHYVEHGQFESRIKHPSEATASHAAPPSATASAGAGEVATPAHDHAAERALVAQYLDAGFYLSSNPDVAKAKLDPVDHYLDHGWNEGRNPTRDFCSAFYLDENPDVSASGINPFYHYLRWGKDQGRQGSSPILDRISLSPVEHAWQKPGLLKHAYDLSVVIPTYNRAHMLPSLLESWRTTHRRTRYTYEIIFSDDGSDDETLAILEAATDLPITLVRNDHGGAAKARNSAVRAASGETILFLGDDIFPDPWLINRHVEKHRELPDTDAVLGFCDWHPDLSVNHLMRHITEIGCEQFSFLALPKHGYTDFRHFYTCNISIDREFLLSEDTIFDEKFYKVNFEDAELGYRLAKKGMRIYYYPEAYGDHYHPYNDVGRFCTRQAIAGEMAIVFHRLHRELAHVVPLSAIERRWSTYLDTSAEVFDFYGSIVALCQDAEDRNDTLDDETKENLSRVYTMLFRFAFEEGYCRHKFTGVTADVSNHVIYGEFLDHACQTAVEKLVKRLKIKKHNAILRALKDLSARAVRPAPRPAPLPVIATAKQNVPARVGISPLPLQIAGTLTILATDWTHLTELMALYAEHRNALRFALTSEIDLREMVYAPDRGAEMSVNSMGQLLLFLELNPTIGQVILSHGLYDLPEIGVRLGKTVDIVRQRGGSAVGKVMRVFGAEATEPLPFDNISNGRFGMLDGNGYFAVQAGRAAA